jgi:heme/copper-type cytochrome/quinol oxidase subunit 2
MIPFMVSWLTLALCVASAAVLHSCYLYRNADHDHSRTVTFIATAVPTILVTVPTIYAFGWLLLPSWGIGAIPFGG